jgi:hypothetical protein
MLMDSILYKAITIQSFSLSVTLNIWYDVMAWSCSAALACPSLIKLLGLRELSSVDRHMRLVRQKVCVPEWELAGSSPTCLTLVWVGVIMSLLLCGKSMKLLWQEDSLDLIVTVYLSFMFLHIIIYSSFSFFLNTFLISSSLIGLPA